MIQYHIEDEHCKICCDSCYAFARYFNSLNQASGFVRATVNYQQVDFCPRCIKKLTFQQVVELSKRNKK